MRGSGAPLLGRFREPADAALLARGGAGILALKIGGAVLAFGVQAFLARVLGVEPFGVYVWVLTWITVLALVAKRGWDATLLRYAATYRARGDGDRLRSVVRKGLRDVAIAGVVVALATAVAVWALDPGRGPMTPRTFWVGCVLIPVLALIDCRRSALQGLGRFGLAYGPDSVLRPVLLAAGLAAVIGVRGTVTAPGAMAINVGVTAGAGLVGAWLLWRAVSATDARAAGPDPSDGDAVVEWRRTARGMMLVSAMTLALSRTDMLLVGLLLDARSAGLYAAATLLATLFSFGIDAANASAAPRLVELHDAGRQAELQRIVSLSARGVLAFAVLLGAVLGTSGPWILGLFGPEFPEAAGVLLILVSGHVALATVGQESFLMTMTGLQQAAGRLLMVGAALNVLLGAASITALGIEGAALATVTSALLVRFAMATVVWRRLGINPTVFASRARLPGADA